MYKADYDMIVVGGGPGGYTAALYGARAGLSVLVLEILSPGGQMATTENVDNYPGFPEGADGFELGEKMQQGAHRFGAVTKFEEVKALHLEETPKRVETVLEIPLSAQESAELQASAGGLRRVIATLPL